MMKDIIRTAENTISEHCLIPEGSHVVAALSGGADSVCLLFILKTLSGDMGFTLSAFHVNHSLRGAESDSDENFCRELCKKQDIPFSSVRVDVMSLVREQKLSTEEAARKLRYDALFAEADRYDRCVIATAHNMCDNAETVLFNMIRGTGMKGICGIPYKRGNIIRPLLDIERNDIEAFLEGIGQDHVTDSTNLSDDYSRNKIRHSIIPVMKEINPAFFEAVSRLSRSAASDEGYFARILSEIPPEEMPDAHPSVRKRYISSLLSENDISVSYDRIILLDRLMSERASTRIDLSGNIYAILRKGRIYVEEIDEYKDISIEIDLKNGNTYDIYDKTVKIIGLNDDISPDDGKVHNKLTNFMLNCDKIHGVVVLRNKRDGDRINLIGRSFETRLKKLYNSLGLGMNERHTALVMEDEDGLIWSEYGGAADRVAALDHMGNICRIEVTQWKK